MCKKNSKLKMSVSEMLFFTRYFGILAEHSVTEKNKWWFLCLKLRPMIGILIAPYFTLEDLND